MRILFILLTIYFTTPLLSNTKENLQDNKVTFSNHIEIKPGIAHIHVKMLNLAYNYDYYTNTVQYHNSPESAAIPATILSS